MRRILEVIFSDETETKISRYWMLYSILCEVHEVDAFSKFNVHLSVYLSHLSFTKILNGLVRSIV
jgi:hypothetical protein